MQIDLIFISGWASLDGVGGRIFRADGRGEPRILRHPTGAQRAWFDASGEKVLTWSGDGRLAFLWTGPAFSAPLVFSRAVADGVQYSRDGRLEHRTV